ACWAWSGAASEVSRQVSEVACRTKRYAIMDSPLSRPVMQRRAWREPTAVPDRRRVPTVDAEIDAVIARGQGARHRPGERLSGALTPISGSKNARGNGAFPHGQRDARS